MTPFCTITPTRSDRPELLAFCKKQLNRMTLRPDKSYFIDYPPLSNRIDLIERIQFGVAMAKKDGYEYAFIIEDDDAYPADYFEHFSIGEYALYGSQETTYYNLRNRTHNHFTHPGRSSLFTTGFKISELDAFNWYAPQNRFLDISLWQYAVENSKGVRQFVETGAIGIKHNLGLCAGKGHLQMGANSDNDLSWLKGKVDKEAFEFYKAMSEKLITQK